MSARTRARVSRLRADANRLSYETRELRDDYVRTGEIYARRLAALSERGAKINRAWRELAQEVNQLTGDADTGIARSELGELRERIDVEIGEQS